MYQVTAEFIVEFTKLRQLAVSSPSKTGRELSKHLEDLEKQADITQKLLLNSVVPVKGGDGWKIVINEQDEIVEYNQEKQISFTGSQEV